MKKILSNIFLAFAVLVFVGIIALVIMNKDADGIYIFGYKPFIVATGSMEPEYMTKSLVLIKQGGYDDIKIGDVVAFESDAMDKKLAFHRTVGKTDEGFITKGDNNSTPDGGVVTRENFIGHEVFHTNWTAYYMREFHKPYGIIRTVILPVIAIIFLILGISFFHGWDANIWLKRLLTSAILLVVCATMLISYVLWDNQRVLYLNDQLKAVVDSFISQTDDATITANNHPVIGVIKIPSIDIEYPVIKYENPSSLNVSINHYSGPPLNSVGNVVLAGHYSALGGNLFFTNINKLRVGDIATIIDDNGDSVDYRVTGFDVHLPDDLSVLESEQPGERELTLISCTTDLKNRYVVKLVEAK